MLADVLPEEEHAVLVDCAISWRSAFPANAVLLSHASRTVGTLAQSWNEEQQGMETIPTSLMRQVLDSFSKRVASSSPQVPSILRLADEALIARAPGG